MPGRRRPVASRLTHVDRSGRARMVDVGDKPVTQRVAVARGAVRMLPATAKKIAANAIAKGDTYQKHRVFFADEAAAIASGYRPCGNCMKPQYAAWKEAQQ